MHYELLNYILYGAGFLLMIFIQALIINGVHECFQGGKIKDELKGTEYYQGMIFYMLAPKFFEKHRYSKWKDPLYGCVRCMSSVFGAITYWPLILWLFGFQWSEIFIFIADVFCLVTVNFLIYKKL